MARNIEGSYLDMPKRYQRRKTKKTFKEEKKNLRKAGAIFENNDGDMEAIHKQIYGVKNLDNFNLSALGAGGAFSKRAGFNPNAKNPFEEMGPGVKRASKSDMKGLLKYGNFADNKLEAAYMLRDYLAKLGVRDGLNDTDGFAGGRAIKYVDKKIAALEARAANKGVGNPELNTTNPVDTAPEPINTAPGTGPGIDDSTIGSPAAGSGGGGGGGNIATTGGAVSTGAGSSSAGGMNTINIGDGNDIFGDVIGRQSIVKNYGGGMGSGSGTPYESAMGLGQQYIDNMEDNLDEYSGPDYGMKITNMGIKTALDNQYIDPAAITQNVAQRNFGLFQLGNLLNNQLYGQYQPPTPFRFDDIDVGDDDDDTLDDLKDLATV